MKRSLRAGVMAAVASLLVCSLLAPALAGAPVAAQSAQDGPADAAGLAISTQEFDADSVEFEITVYENGSATWTFRYLTSLETDEDRQNFEAYAEEFETNQTELYTAFREGATRLTTNGSEATGREMRAENFQRDARTEGLDPAQSTRGVVEMSFRWEGFARVGDRVVMGDVFEGGLYVGSDQQLVIRAGPTLAFADVQPDDGEFDEGTMADSESVTWDGGSGGVEFNPGRPRVEFVEAGSAPATAAPAESSTGWMVPVLAVLVVVLLCVGAIVAYQTDSLPALGDGSWPGSDPDEDGGASAAAGTAGSAGAGEMAEASTGVPDEELISDEERVVTLLENNDGRMKQVKIVDETGWSKSKVSMLLSDMEEEGTISKLRVGRENIVSLAGHEPTAAGSPFDDDGEKDA
jgi:hypothetical protein